MTGYILITCSLRQFILGIVSVFSMILKWTIRLIFYSLNARGFIRAKSQKSSALTIVGSSGIELPTRSGSSGNPVSLTAVSSRNNGNKWHTVTDQLVIATCTIESRIRLEYGQIGGRHKTNIFQF